jgi:hypothetical protein
MWHCTQQHENREEAKFCSKCGEKRVTRTVCSKCGSLLEPEDVFCTSCGHPRDAEQQPPPASAPVTPKAHAPMEVPVPQAQVIANAPQQQPEAEKPVTFSFGGATIAMKDDSKPDTAKPARPRKGMSAAMSGILSFVLIAAVLGAALYLITR